MKDFNSAPVKIDKYNYQGFHGCDSFCTLYVWPKQNMAIAQHVEYGGTSPMNMAEGLAQQVIEEFKLDMKKTTWINYVPAELHTSHQEDFTQIDFSIKKKLIGTETSFYDANFNHIHRDSVIDCIEGKLNFKVKHKTSYSIS